MRVVAMIHLLILQPIREDQVMSSFLNGGLARSISPESLAVVGREFDGLFEQLFGGNRNACDTNGCKTSTSGCVLRAPLHVWEKEEQLHISMDLPGIAKENVSITYEHGYLSIVAERKAPEIVDHKDWHNSVAYGQYKQRVAVGETYHPDSIEAQLNDGILHVRLTKKPEVLPKKIEVR